MTRARTALFNINNVGKNKYIYIKIVDLRLLENVFPFLEKSVVFLW